MEAFQECVFHDGRAISEAVNANHKNFDDVLKVAAQARKFKDWIADRPEDADLRNEYIRAVQELDWIDRLPAKSLRWVLFAIGGAVLSLIPPPIGPVASTTLSISDTFLVDKLLKGWKPNQFVAGPLKEFVKKTSNLR